METRAEQFVSIRPLPMATGIMPWMTPVAALGLAIIVLMATGFHLRGDERLQALETGLWAATAAVVAIGRWNLVVSRAALPAWVLMLALSLLIPSVIINVIVLLKRPMNPNLSPATERSRGS